MTRTLLHERRRRLDPQEPARFALDARRSRGSALFGLCWLFVHVAHRIEAGIQAATGGPGPMRMLRGLGGSSMDFSTAAIEMAFWNHPFVLLMFAVWAIARGSGAVAGEIERGTMDLVLSRPVVADVVPRLAGRWSPLGGLALMAAAMVAGNLVGTPVQHPAIPPSASTLAEARARTCWPSAGRSSATPSCSRRSTSSAGGPT